MRNRQLNERRRRRKENNRETTDNGIKINNRVSAAKLERCGGDKHDQTEEESASALMSENPG